jgi:hypothetical protein
VNIFYPIIAIPADVSEDVPYLIIFMKGCTKVQFKCFVRLPVKPR